MVKFCNLGLFWLDQSCSGGEVDRVGEGDSLPTYLKCQEISFIYTFCAAFDKFRLNNYIQFFYIFLHESLVFYVDFFLGSLTYLGHWISFVHIKGILNCLQGQSYDDLEIKSQIVLSA